MSIFAKYFSGKSILITGASRGLGKALTEELYRCDANVTALAKNSQNLKSLKHEFPKIETICVDLCDWGATREALRRINSPFHGIVNNAGVGFPESVMKITPQTFKTVMETNLAAVINVTQMTVPNMITAGNGGSIVNISSMTSVRGTNLGATYSISKCGLNMLTRLMAVELGKHKIRVNAVCPAGFETDLMVSTMDFHFGKGIGMDIRNKATVKRTPLGKPLLEIQEVVNAVLFVLSDSVPFLTGHSLVIDGGFTCT